MMRDAVRRVMDGIGGIEVLEEVDNGLDAIRAAKVHRRTLVVLDLAMPYARGIEVLLEIR